MANKASEFGWKDGLVDDDDDDNNNDWYLLYVV